MSGITLRHSKPRKSPGKCDIDLCPFVNVSGECKWLETYTLGDFTFWIISVLILEYKIIVNLADEFRSYPVVRIDIRIIRKLN